MEKPFLKFYQFTIAKQVRISMNSEEELTWDTDLIVIIFLTNAFEFMIAGLP